MLFSVYVYADLQLQWMFYAGKYTVPHVVVTVFVFLALCLSLSMSGLSLLYTVHFYFVFL
jgi:hypothetical protein